VGIPRRLATRRLYAELAAFGVVGAACLVADIALFNALAFGAGLNPVLAKLLGLVITGLMAFFGHRHITFRHRHGGGYGREVSRFLASTVATVILSLVPLYVARHLAGITTIVGLNVANLIGVGLGTVARYLAYRHIVWVHVGSDEPVGEAVAASWVADDQPGSGRPEVAAGARASLPRNERGTGGVLQLQDELVGE
jgi:putative flippase GtrA